MTQRCFVPNCSSGREASVHPIAFFNVPTNDELRKKWAEAIPKTGVPLYRTDLVCEKHFFESDIIRHQIVQDAAGNVVDKVAYEHPRLVETAVPSIFPGFELRLNQPQVANISQPIVVQNASDLTYNHIPSATAPPELDIDTTNLATRVGDIKPQATSPPPPYNDSENPPLGWVIPEVAKHSPDSKVNKSEIAGNYHPISQPLMEQPTSHIVTNPMNDYIQDAKDQRKYDSYGQYRNNAPLITNEPMPVTFHPVTIAPVPKRTNNDDDSCENCCLCCLGIVECLNLCVHCIACCAEISK